MNKLKILILLIILTLPLLGQSDGKLTGTILDKDSAEPILGVNVIITGGAYPIGAATDINGRYTILNIPSAVYEIKLSFIGKKDVVVKNVRISSGHTTEMNFEMEDETIAGETVIVTAQRALVKTDATSNVSIATAEDIENLPIRGLGNIVASSAGVVSQDGDMHFRGGRDGEVGYFVNGVSTKNPYSGGNSIRVIHEAIEEVHVLTGGYTAEMGGANSGIVATEMKSGTSKFKVSVKGRTDGFTNPEKGKKLFNTYSYGHRSLIGTISGPLYKDKVTFFLAGEYEMEEDNEVNWVTGYEFNDLVDQSPYNKVKDTLDVVFPNGFTPESMDEDFTLNGSITFDLPIRVTLTGLYSTSETQTGNPTFDLFER